MKDPFNPTALELTEWASTPGVFAPVEDWDLIITHEERIGTIFDLAADASLPNWDFFLACLYIFVGDAIGSEFRAYPRTSVDELLTRVGPDAPAYLHRWRERSESLLTGRTEFSYELWCGHGFVVQERADAS